MEPGFHRSHRDADDVGDLGERVSGVVMQDEDRAVLWRQPRERTIEGVPVVDRDRRIRPTRSVDREDRDPGDPASMAAQLLVTGIDEQPVQPWTEPLRVAQPREFTPGEEECLLDGVLGSLGIAQDAIRDREAKVTVEGGHYPPRGAAG